MLSPLAYLEEQGFRVTYLTVDENGQISLDELRDAVCEDTILVSMMMVNNEIGAVEPIAEAAKIVKRKESEYDHPCGCDSGIWKIPYLSEKTWD